MNKSRSSTSRANLSASSTGSKVIGDIKLPKSVVEHTVKRLDSSPKRVEFLDTPGPYTYKDTKDIGKIPYRIRTSERFPKTAPPMKDRIEFDRAVIEPKPIYVVFSTQSRFPKAEVATRDASKYDVERGIQAIEPKTFCATFGRKASPTRKVSPEKEAKRPEEPILTAELYNTIAHTTLRGGNLGNASTRDTLKSFILHTESPGPIYNPSYSQVEPSGGSGVFSSQKRLPTPKFETPSPLAYADSVNQVDKLSTRPRSPMCTISNVPRSMPLPYNEYNIWNSRSMRTMLCYRSDLYDEYGRPRKASPDGSAVFNHSALSRKSSRLSPHAAHNASSRQESPKRRPSSRPGTADSSSILARPESAARWVQKRQEHKKQVTDPKKFVVADSPFCARHSVPNAVRTFVLTNPEADTEDEFMKAVEAATAAAKAKDRIALIRRASTPSTQLQDTSHRADIHAYRPSSVKPSRAVERLRKVTETAKQKRHQQDQQFNEQDDFNSGSSPELSPVRGSDQRPGSAAPGLHHRYTPKYPRLFPDEGYHSVAFTEAVQQHLDDHLPLEKKSKIPANERHWMTSSPPPALVSAQTTEKPQYKMQSRPSSSQHQKLFSSSSSSAGAEGTSSSPSGVRIQKSVGAKQSAGRGDSKKTESSLELREDEDDHLSGFDSPMDDVNDDDNELSLRSGSGVVDDDKDNAECMEEHGRTRSREEEN